MFASDFYDALLLVCDVDKFFCVSLRANLVGKLGTCCVHEDLVGAIDVTDVCKVCRPLQSVAEHTNRVRNGWEVSTFIQLTLLSTLGW